MKKILSFVLWIVCTSPLFSQPELLQSGPMVGHVKAGATQLWVQTKKEATVKIKYFETDFPEPFFYTKEYRTVASEGFTAPLLADQTVAGKLYSFELYINNIPVPRPYPLRFKTGNVSSVPGSFKVAMGSCVYVNDTLTDNPENYKGGSYEIYNAIVAKNPDMMLWLGDNVYLRKKEWMSKEGMLYRYTHTRSLSFMQPLLGSAENLAIWDDHDYGPNDSDKEFKNKETSLEVFKLFWANPSYGSKEMPSVATTFVKEDVQFFFLDDRSFRDPGEDSEDRNEILGKKQLDWLITSLRASKSTFKVIAMGGQVLNPLKVYENYSKYEKERSELLKQLAAQKIPGVVFLSGDRHFSESMKMERSVLPPLYEFTVSPLNSKPHTEVQEENPIRIPGSLIKENNFATMEFFGKENERALRMSYYDKDGKLFFETVVKAKELK